MTDVHSTTAHDVTGYARQTVEVECPIVPVLFRLFF